MSIERFGKNFMTQTQHDHLTPPPQGQGVPQPPLELPYSPTAPLIDLPAPDALPVAPLDLRALIEQRTSVRRYSAQPLRLEELAYLLWCTQGVKRVTDRPVTLRTVPSAGARHAFETYLLINRVEGLAQGLYRYIALEHALLRVDASADIAARLTDGCAGQRMVAESAVTFFWTAVAERMTWRYSERSYRYLHLDAGHVCQNLYLAAESIGCGVCAVAAFDDEKINAVLGLDGETQFLVYAAPLGRRLLPES